MCVFIYTQGKRLTHLTVDNNFLEEFSLIWGTGILKLWLYELSASFALFFWVWARISPVVCIDSFTLNSYIWSIIAELQDLKIFIYAGVSLWIWKETSKRNQLMLQENAEFCFPVFQSWELCLVLMQTEIIVVVAFNTRSIYSVLWLRHCYLYIQIKSAWFSKYHQNLYW